MPKKNTAPKKKGKKKESKKPQTILEMIMDEQPTAMHAGFSLSQLVMDDKYQWHLKLNVKMRLPQSYESYRLQMIFDEQPHLNEMERLSGKVDEISGEQNLFSKTKYNQQRKDLKAAQEKLDKEKEKYDDLKKRCETIEILAGVEILKYNLHATVVTMTIPDTVIGQLNELKHLLGYYELVLTPHYGGEKKDKDRA